MCKYGKTIEMEIDGKWHAIDECVANLVYALNRGGFKTLASCCGHGNTYGRISLEGGRDLVIMSFDEASKLFATQPKNIHGELKEE